MTNDDITYINEEEARAEWLSAKQAEWRRDHEGDYLESLRLEEERSYMEQAYERLEEFGA